jgi:hypothetical protein
LSTKAVADQVAGLRPAVALLSITSLRTGAAEGTASCYWKLAAGVAGANTTVVSLRGHVYGVAGRPAPLDSALGAALVRAR